MRLVPRILCLLALLSALPACGALEDVAETEGAVTSQAFKLGNIASVYVTPGFGVQHLWKQADFLHTPTGAESDASWWQDVWQADNGGTCTIPQNPIVGTDGVHGSGNLNQVRFRIERNNTYGLIDTYTVNIDFTYSDGSLCIYRAGAVSLTVPGQGAHLDRNHYHMVWSAGSAQIAAFNSLGVMIAQTDPYAFVFPAGPGVITKVHSPQQTIRMDTARLYGGCYSDVPDYDELDTDDWTYQEMNLYGATSATVYPAYVMAPLSQAHCSQGVRHDPANLQDILYGHQEGVDN